MSTKNPIMDTGSTGVTKVTDAWFSEFMVPHLNDMYHDLTGSSTNNGTYLIDRLKEFSEGPGGASTSNPPQGGG